MAASPDDEWNADFLDLDDAWKDRLTRDVFGRQVPFMGVAALRKNKLASGRPKDLVDAAWLQTTYPVK